MLAIIDRQAATLVSFPAPLTMCTVTSMMGAVFTAILQVGVEGKIFSGIVVLGGGAFQAWCLGKKGPLLVSIFGPVQIFCSAILSALLFRQMLSLGSLVGIVLMFCGLYVVLWEERQLEVDQIMYAEKALLS